MTLNDLLGEWGIDPKQVLVLRHTPPRKTEGRLRKALFRLAMEEPRVFNAYQQSQFKRQEEKMSEARYIASFIGHAKDQAIFVGLYENVGSIQLTREQYWKIPENVESRDKYGMRGFAEDDDRPSIRWFSLERTGFGAPLKGKLVIGWPKGEYRQWDRWAVEREWPILSPIEADKVVVQPTLPPMDDDCDGAPARALMTTYRVLRDTAMSIDVKRLHNFECQICGKTLHLPNGRRYAEAHHIKPLGREHNGPDRRENILCLCPNHHAELDYLASELDVASLATVDGHAVGKEFVAYHNVQRFGCPRVNFICKLGYRSPATASARRRSNEPHVPPHGRHCFAEPLPLK